MSSQTQNWCLNIPYEKNRALWTVPLVWQKMGFDVDNIPNRKIRNKEWGKYVAQLSSPIVSIGLFTFKRQGSMGNWIIPFKLNWGDDKTSKDFISAVVNTTREAPVLLSKRQTLDAVNSIAFATGCSKSFGKAILTAVLPDGTLRSFNTYWWGNWVLSKDSYSMWRLYQVAVLQSINRAKGWTHSYRRHLCNMLWRRWYSIAWLSPKAQENR